MTTDHDDTEFEPTHSLSPTDHVLTELQLYGYRPLHDEPDPRPLPEGNAVAGAIATSSMPSSRPSATRGSNRTSTIAPVGRQFLSPRR